MVWEEICILIISSYLEGREQFASFGEYESTFQNIEVGSVVGTSRLSDKAVFIPNTYKWLTEWH